MKSKGQLEFNLLFLLVFFFIGCQSHKHKPSVPIVEVDATSSSELVLSEYFDHFRMIKLPNDSIMGEIERIKYDNNHIFITDGRTLFIFSEDGTILNCFEKLGSGPGEYSEITDFTVDGNSVIVMDRNQQKLITYDISGTYLASHNLEYNTQAISPIVDNAFYLYCSINDHYKLRRFKEGKEISSHIPNDTNRENHLFIFAHQNFHQHKKSVYFFQPLNDTVYVSNEGEDIKPYLFVDFKGKNIPTPFIKKKYADVKDFFDQLHNKPYAYGIYSFAMSEKSMIFCSFYRKDKKLIVYDKESQLTNTFATIKDDVYFKGKTFSISQFIYHADKQHLFVPIEAYSILEWGNSFPITDKYKNIVQAIEEKDNPILLIFKSK